MCVPSRHNPGAPSNSTWPHTWMSCAPQLHACLSTKQGGLWRQVHLNAESLCSSARKATKQQGRHSVRQAAVASVGTCCGAKGQNLEMPRFTGLSKTNSCTQVCSAPPWRVDTLQASPLADVLHLNTSHSCTYRAGSSAAAICMCCPAALCHTCGRQAHTHEHHRCCPFLLPPPSAACCEGCMEDCMEDGILGGALQKRLRPGTPCWDWQMSYYSARQVQVHPVAPRKSQQEEHKLTTTDVSTCQQIRSNLTTVRCHFYCDTQTAQHTSQVCKPKPPACSQLRSTITPCCSAC